MRWGGVGEGPAHTGGPLGQDRATAVGSGEASTVLQPGHPAPSVHGGQHKPDLEGPQQLSALDCGGGRGRPDGGCLRDCASDSGSGWKKVTRRRRAEEGVKVVTVNPGSWLALKTFMEDCTAHVVLVQEHKRWLCELAGAGGWLRARGWAAVWRAASQTKALGRSAGRWYWCGAMWAFRALVGHPKGRSPRRTVAESRTPTCGLA